MGYRVGGQASTDLVEVSNKRGNTVDFTDLIAAVDFASVTTALMSVGAAVAAVLIARRGIRMVLSAISR